ncbi:MAG TPA: M20/M25/M40 family metallo-hydrolase, partial [Thermomicrobiales bacterium]|nr:M20/M25/M40 family metallo-hydrolase [Thermomicrobiales bacterium]
VVELGIDVRGTVAADRAAVVAALREDVARIAAARGLAADLQTTSDEAPVPLAPGLVATLERHARARGLRCRRMVSGSGHDAMQLARLCPAGLLMVPSRGGVSHNRAEWTDLADIVAGTQVLCDAALDLAGIETPGAE